jgi:hypothetical protein
MEKSPTNSETHHDEFQAHEEKDNVSLASSVSRVSGDSVGQLIPSPESDVGKYDMLAFVDLLKATGKTVSMSSVAQVKVDANMWKKKAQRESAAINHGSIASLLTILLACQALELAGASLVSKRIEKLARSKNKKEESVFKVYLRSHSTHFAVEIDCVEDRVLPPHVKRRVSSIKHFNISNWEVAMHLIELLLT